MLQEEFSFVKDFPRPRNPRGAGRKPIDLTSQRFGRWLVLERERREGFMHAHWLCRCDCGTTRAVSSDGLRTGRSRSCGCWNREAARENMRKLLDRRKRA